MLSDEMERAIEVEQVRIRELDHALRRLDVSPWYFNHWQRLDVPWVDRYAYHLWHLWVMWLAELYADYPEEYACYLG
jgi:hypothetical protein